MPSSSKLQARLIAADYGRAKQGKATRTGMTLGQLTEWASADAKKAKHKKRSCQR